MIFIISLMQKLLKFIFYFSWQTFLFLETILNDDAGGIDYMQDEEAFNGLVDESTDANKESNLENNFCHNNISRAGCIQKVLLKTKQNRI